MSIKDLVKGDKTVSFLQYVNGNLQYKTDCGFVFPVPVSDIGDATFPATDRAMLYMRYMRKHIDAIGDIAKGYASALPVTAQTQASVQFARFKGGEAWYVGNDGFEFPVPVAEYNDALHAVEAAATLARYIDNHRDYLAAALRESNEA